MAGPPGCSPPKGDRPPVGAPLGDVRWAYATTTTSGEPIVTYSDGHHGQPGALFIWVGSTMVHLPGSPEDVGVVLRRWLAVVDAARLPDAVAP